MKRLAEITERLANVVRSVPCTCRKTGEWPIFANAKRAHVCHRCAALAEYDAYVAIVQEPR